MLKEINEFVLFTLGYTEEIYLEDHDFVFFAPKTAHDYIVDLSTKNTELADLVSVSMTQVEGLEAEKQNLKEKLELLNTQFDEEDEIHELLIKNLQDEIAELHALLDIKTETEEEDLTG